MQVEVVPETFTFVEYSSEVIADIAQELGRALGIADDVPLRIEVDEATPLGVAMLASVDPPVITVESGALEDAKRPRHLSTVGAATVLGIHLAELRDRLDPAFGAPPPAADVPPHHRCAWEVYAAGRIVRLGYDAHDQRQRRLYHFRIRHRFTDVADAAFDKLWTSDGLTWADITSLSDEAKSSD